MGDLWNVLFFDPMLNGLIVLYGVLLNNFGLAIIIFTLLVRVLILPLTLKQLNATKAMSAVQPQLRELQKKFAKSKEKLAQEQMKLYREAGISPLGCLWPMLVQFPVWIALYQVIVRALPQSPDDLMGLWGHLYSWPQVLSVVPLKEGFLWLNLGTPDRFMVLPVLVAGTMWVQQKMVTTPTADPRQATTNRFMLWTMPLMFGFFTLSFPSGLAVYWVVSNVAGIVIQYFVSGWGPLLPARSQEKGSQDGKPGIQRPERRRSYSKSTSGIRGQERRTADKGAEKG